MRPLLAPLLLCAACATTVGSGDPPAAEYERVLAAEDARAATAEQLGVLQRGLRSEHASIRALAVRAMGRTERAGLADVISIALADADAGVRAAAAHALADVTRDTVTAATRATLLSALPGAGSDPGLAAAAAEALGRLRHDAAAAGDVAQRIALLLRGDATERRGALRGFYFLARQQNGRTAVSAHAAQLADVVLNADSARDRALALSTLTVAGAVPPPLVSRAIADADWTVRREAVLAAGSVRDAETVRSAIERGLRDAAPQVRHDAVRVHGRLSGESGCAVYSAALRDDAAQVSIAAAGIMAAVGCRGAPQLALLDSVAGSLREDAWHRAAAAGSALAALGAAAARAHVERLAQHANPFARTHAARAAGALEHAALLRTLAADPHPNVRTAAVTALSAVVGHGADDLYIAQLDSGESELIQAAAAALEGSRHPRAADALLAALERVTAQQSETSRDARNALLVRLQELGSRGHAARLQPYLSDFDPAVAGRAADVLAHWTGVRPAVAPRPLAAPALPRYADLQQLARSRFIVELEDGGEISIALLPFEAPTNAWRFARLARDGYFDGLTVHRVVPNFVVQGGSPGANEYSGHPRFSRDELGAPNWRGTVGLSTRGRDTGDAQFYINLIDNIRLDHEYTIFGVVTEGMEHVDRLLEGAVIRRVRESTRGPQ